MVASGLDHGVLALDALGVATTLLAAWWWYLTGTPRLRRASRFEALEAANPNRIATSINRNAVLGCRAALAAAVSAVRVVLRFAVDFVSTR